MRKATHESFNIRVAKDYKLLQEQAAYRLLKMLLDQPKERGWDQDIER